MSSTEPTTPSGPDDALAPTTPVEPSAAGEPPMPTAPVESSAPVEPSAPGEPRVADAPVEPPVPAGGPMTPEAPVPAEAPVPTEAELAREAQPAVVRRAPKFGAFITAGALLGIVLALAVTLVIQPDVPRRSDGSGFLPFLDGENAVRTVMAVAGAVLGGFVGGLLAVVADRRSVRRARRAD
ncbi:hypothetical protein [Cellulomonas sp. URHB0016]